MSGFFCARIFFHELKDQYRLETTHFSGETYNSQLETTHFCKEMAHALLVKSYFHVEMDYFPLAKDNFSGELILFFREIEPNLTGKSVFPI